MKRFLINLLPLTLFAFENTPYLTELAEFHLRPSYTYRHYPSVQNLPTNYSSNDQFPVINLGVRFLPQWEAQFDLETAKTRARSFGTQSFAAQLRTQILSDIAGDPISLLIGGRLRYVTSHSLHDLSCPYHATLNLSAIASLGKEFDPYDNVSFRLWLFTALGIGNRGAPYITPDLHFDTIYAKSHTFSLFALSDWGLGSKRVSLSQFGYANVAHRSIDLGAKYKYDFGMYGSLSLAYAYRIYAHNFPNRANTVMLKYDLPFSLL